ncbi:MAG: glutathione peroxidase [Planctomycetota bacterium]|nr:MAG: glutathione peroxidase [Planctomycetota bacterium]
MFPRFACAALAASAVLAAPTEGPDRAPDDPTQVLSFTVNRIDGTPQRLEDYRGKVVMIVNVASKCGYTPQYADLQAVYEKYKDRGFVVLGFPANNFRNQEPGSNYEIAEFCTKEYGVTFPMFEKISVMGEDQHPLYKKLTGAPEPIGGPVRWNFQKYLVDRTGRVVGMIPTQVKPTDEAVEARIESLLAADPG